MTMEIAEFAEQAGNIVVKEILVKKVLNVILLEYVMNVEHMVMSVVKEISAMNMTLTVNLIRSVA